LCVGGGDEEHVNKNEINIWVCFIRTLSE